MRYEPLRRAIFVGVVVAAVVLLGGVWASGAQTVSPLEEARLEALAARQEVMRLQGELAKRDRDYAECASTRGLLELTINKAVIDGKMAGFVKDYEVAHPGYTWDFAAKGPKKKDGR